MSATLLILAAGLGTRFGKGIKQLTPVGDNGETLMELSIMDAVKAGFDNVVFVIRRDIEKQIREIIDTRVSKIVHADYCFQDMYNIPWGISSSTQRKKPWGTVHAVLAAKHIINEPFAIINADDYYGKNAYRAMHRFLTSKSRKPDEQAMCGYALANTLSRNGAVTRGVCSIDKEYMLTGVAETYNIIKSDNQIIGSVGGKDGKGVVLDPKSLVSMNLWGFDSSMFQKLESLFAQFLQREPDIQDEYALPVAVNSLIRSHEISVKVIPVYDKWFGMTSSKDVSDVKNGLKEINDD